MSSSFVKSNEVNTSQFLEKNVLISYMQYFFKDMSTDSIIEKLMDRCVTSVE